MTPMDAPSVPRLRPRRWVALLMAGLACLIVACESLGIGVPTPTPTPSPSPTVDPTPVPTPRPTPTPTTTPTYTNVPDPELVALVPESVGGSAVEIPGEISLTPGDVGSVYGEHGRRFRSLVVAFTDEPRLTLFAMRVDDPPVTTQQLEPQLPEIGQYLGISELDAEAWTLAEVAGRDVWMRGEDEATSPGTQIYTWADDDLVFLLIGTDEAHNVAMITALPGAAPAPS